MTVITRFAPSPTGYLHIGGARTALFNWLFAKHHGGKFLLRVEDTDRERSTQEAVNAILEGMQWLGLAWDDEVFYQNALEKRHREIAEQLLAEGKAYKCYCTPEELTQMREEARKAGLPYHYDRRWRERDSDKDIPEGIEPTIRLKTPLEGQSTINDAVQGSVTIQHSELDDMIILRSDGTPTYMLAVVVDDHDMGITHVIRGDDHLNNAFKQKVIFDALGWEVPIFAHVPLIHGPDGAKFSKRHGALGIGAYRDMGYLPEAMRNYLLRLGWSHGDDEIISTQQAIEWFGLNAVGKSPARFDFDKLANVNAHYMKEADNNYLFDLVASHLPAANDAVKTGITTMKERAKTIPELAESLQFYITRPPFTDKALQHLTLEAKNIIGNIIPILNALDNWDENVIHDALKAFVESQNIGFGNLGKPMRAALVGDMAGPNIAEIMAILGKEETLARLNDIP